MDNKIEITDISKKSRIVALLSIGLPFVIAFIYGANTKEEFALFGLSALFLFWLSSYILEKGKIILKVGSFLEKDKRFYLFSGSKKIDSLRIRNEEDTSESEVLKKFEDFIFKNNIQQYQKIYLTGSDSKDDIKIIENILNK